MHIDHFKVFCDLAETQSFSKAAAIHGITQSAVSQKVRGLEERVGVTLIERGRRNFSLTPEGLAMLAASREILAIYNDLGARLQMARNIVAGELHVAVIFSIGLHELPPRLKLFRQKHPEVQVHVEFRRSPQVYQAVLDGEVDLGLVAFPAKRTGLTYEVFDEDEMVLIAAPSHPLTESETVAVAKLAGEKFVSFEADAPTRKVIDRFLRDHHVEPAIVMEFDNIETVKRAVEVENGVSIVPANTVREEVKTGLLKSVRLSEPLSRPLGIIYQRNRARTPAQAEFIAALRSRQ